MVLLLNFPNRQKRNIYGNKKAVDVEPSNYVPTGEQEAGFWFDKAKEKSGNMNNVPSIEKIGLEEELSRAYDVPSTPRTLNLTEYDEVVIMVRIWQEKQYENHKF